MRAAGRCRAGGPKPVELMVEDSAAPWSDREGNGYAIANSEVSNLKKLAAGRVDVALILTDQIKTDSMMLKEAQAEHMSFLFAAAPMDSYLGFSVRHPDGERARTLFNEGYRIISANGVRRAIAKKWHLH